MKQFVVYILAVFLGLFLAVVYRNEHKTYGDNKPLLKVFAYSSFVSQWGPGPVLKQEFEKQCNCQVEFYDASDSATMIQRLQLEGTASGADVVIGLDQYDLERAEKAFSWKKINLNPIEFSSVVKPYRNSEFFIPYDWGVLAFVFRKSEVQFIPKNFVDLLSPEFKRKIALQDPRTSSPGLQFLFWLVKTKGEEEAFKFLEQLAPNVHSMAASWSSAYAFFQKGQAMSVFSYTTSPIYHLIEQQSEDYVAAEFSEGHPIQIEYAGIPSFCKQCQLADQFLNFVISKESQKIIMEKNYMLPVVDGVAESTNFSKVKKLKVIEGYSPPSISERERILNKWNELRRSGAF